MLGLVKRGCTRVRVGEDGEGREGEWGGGEGGVVGDKWECLRADRDLSRRGYGRGCARAGEKMFDLPSSIDVRPMVEWEEERICSDGGLERGIGGGECVMNRTPVP